MKEKIEQYDTVRKNRYRFTAFAIFITALMLPLGSIFAQSGVQFMGPVFAKKLCTAWNNSSLVKKLAEERKGGNGWIKTENKYLDKYRGKQVLMISRRDCARGHRVQLTITNQNGMAVCTYGGRRTSKYSNSEWAFAPVTTDWFSFAAGNWGMFAMRKLMNGMRGPMTVAFTNRHNFGIFWKITGSLAKSMNADYTTQCKLDSDDLDDIKGYLKKIR